MYHSISHTAALVLRPSVHTRIYIFIYIMCVCVCMCVSNERDVRLWKGYFEYCFRPEKRRFENVFARLICTRSRGIVVYFYFLFYRNAFLRKRFEN